MEIVFILVYCQFAIAHLFRSGISALVQMVESEATQGLLPLVVKIV